MTPVPSSPPFLSFSLPFPSLSFPFLVGLNSVLIHDGFLYATYMVSTPPWGDNCQDSGQMDGRPLEAVLGCRVTGRTSRWPYALGRVTGPEQVIIDGDINNQMCGQFSTHGMTCIVAERHEDGTSSLYIAAGDGAAFTAPDVGECCCRGREEGGGGCYLMLQHYPSSAALLALAELS